MGIDDCQDPLNPESDFSHFMSRIMRLKIKTKFILILIDRNWWNDFSGPVFYKNELQGVYTTGHCSFTTSPGRKSIECSMIIDKK